VRALTNEERARYIHVPEVDRDRARVAVVPFLTPGTGGMTLGRFILLRRGREDDRQLLAHELVHVRQWREEGVFGFLWRYLRAYLSGRRRGLSHREAYRSIYFEVEARELADD
jgi:Domain of unknown function (DUF4157)